MKALFIFLGTLTLAIGTLGIILPVLPTTPFLLISAACYMKSSTVLYERLVNHKIFGKYIRAYKNRNIPPITKIIAVAMLWAALAYSIYMIPVTAAKIVLTLIGVGVTIHIAKR